MSNPPTTQRRVLAALTAAGPEGLTTDALVEAVYGDRADGGPLQAKNNIAQAVHALRRTVRIDAVPARYVLGRKAARREREAAQQGQGAAA